MENKLNQIKIKCPAKINLTLEILNKREDGFHNIQSVMQTINLFDILTIQIEKSNEFIIELSGTSDEIPYNEKNLVYKAAKLFVDEALSSSVVNINDDCFPKKNLPDEFKQVILTRAKKLRKEQTVPENILWYFLRAKRFMGLKFKRQVPIGKYIVDFVCFEKKLIIELDGSGHLELEKIEYDKKRDNFLKSQGFSVLRIYNNDVFENIEAVLEYIYCKLNIEPPLPQPLPHKWGGEQSCSPEIFKSITINSYDVVEDNKSENLENIKIEKFIKNQEEINSTGFINNFDNERFIGYVKNELEIEQGAQEVGSLKSSAALSSSPVEGEERGEGDNSGPQKYKISIHIEKNIPISAGLAGGSTDAAGTLYGLNKLFNNVVSSEKLHEICAKLGSDLNFCLEGGCQLTTGRGEILQTLPFQEFNLQLIKPKNIGISAKEAYTKFSVLKQKPNKNMTMKVVEALKKGKISVEKYLHNDLEYAVIDDYKELREIKNSSLNSIMSGSGSTFFVVEDKFKNLGEEFWISENLKSIPIGVVELKD